MRALRFLVFFDIASRVVVALGTNASSDANASLHASAQ